MYQLDQRIYDIITGKRVALVGPGRGLMGTRYGPAINEYDVVCRINEVYPWDFEADYGNRTDIIFHSLGGGTIKTLTRALERNHYVSQQLKALVLPQLSGNDDDNRLESAAILNRDPQRYGRRHVIGLSHIGDEWWHECAEEIGSSPNTGYLAILMLLKYDIKELLICGMDFYADGDDHGTSHYPPYMSWGGEDFKPQSPNRAHNQEHQKTHFIETVLPQYKHLLTLQGAVCSGAGLDREGATIWQPEASSLHLPDRQLLSLTRGRRVVLVGPAPYLAGTGSGSIIDEYDVVIRINQVGAFGEEADYGSRTDILIHADGEPTAKALAATIAKHKKYSQNIEYTMCIGSASTPTLCHELGRMIGWAPNTGIAAACMLLEYLSPAELFITGFSFYQEGQRVRDRHSKSYRKNAEPAAKLDECYTAQSGRTNQEPQRKWLKRMTEKFSDILRVDGRLATILGEHMPTSIQTATPKKYAVYRAYYGEDFIRQSIESVRPYVDDVFVFWSDKAFADVTGIEWDGEWVEFPKPADKLPEIVAEMSAADPAIHLIYDHWGVPDAQWSHLINDRILAEYERPELIICMEPDMVWEQSDLPHAISYAMGHGVLAAQEITHWREIGYCVTRETPRPGPVFYDMTGVDRVSDTQKNAWPNDAGAVEYMTACCHNMGFCVSSKSMLLKHLTGMAFGAAISDSLPNPSWLHDKWETWHPIKNNKALEISLGHEYCIAKAVPYTGAIPETLTEDG